MFITKALFLFACMVAVYAAADEPVLGGDHIVGGIKPLHGKELEEAEEVLKGSLAKLAAGEGPSYTLSKIVSASHQVVAGSSYRYVVELSTPEGESRNCEISIWVRSWLPNGTEVTFNGCDGTEAKVVRTHD